MALHPQSEPGDGESEGGLGGELLAAVRLELADERARQASLESRCMTIAAAAVTATALVFGLGPDYSGRWDAFFSVLLLVAVLIFIASAITAWTVARLRGYEQPQLAEFRRLIEEGWEGDVDELRLYIADGTMTALEDARKNNDTKATTFDWAIRLLVAGVGVVAVELVIVALDAILG